MSDTTKKKRRWFQFSTVGLLVLMTVAALCMKFVRHGVLDERTEVVFAPTPVWDVLDYLSNKHHFNWRTDDAAFVDAGISFYGESPVLAVTDQVTDAPLGETLDRFFAPHGLGFYIENGELVVTTRAAADAANSGLGALRQRFADLNVRP